MSGLGPFEPNAGILGDSIEVMAQFPDACVDAIVTDPPYGLEFMGKEWDRLYPDKGKWRGHERASCIVSEKDTPQHRHGVRQPAFLLKCAKCGGNSSGEWNRCKCEAPDFRRPPIGQLQQEWHRAWATEAYRILKPGAYMLVLGGTRTHHRLGCGLEDAGFEIRDCLAWIYASGFPKSHDVSKAIDKKAGAEREVVGEYRIPEDSDAGNAGKPLKDVLKGWQMEAGIRHITQPATSEAQYWDGYGTALKPAHEPIWLCKKPNEGTYVDNVLRHGCGAMNIDGSRISLVAGEECRPMKAQEGGNKVYKQAGRYEPTLELKPSGRWPANVLVDCYPEEFIGGGVVLEREIRLHGPPKEGLRGPEITWEKTEESEGDLELWVFVEEYFDDEEMVYGPEGIEEGCAVYPYTQFVWLRRIMGEVVIEGEAQLHHGGLIRASKSIGDGNIYQGGGPGLRREPDESSRGNGLLGPYTRFFVIPKPSKAEKNKGCMGLYWRREKGGGHTQIGRKEWEKLVAEEKRIYEETGKRVRLQDRGNIHVTVKPVRLMKWLIRLMTPHQHPVVVIDPFCGSGTSMVAAEQLNWEEGYQMEFYGIDKGENNITITNARLEEEKGAAKQLKLV